MKIIDWFKTQDYNAGVEIYAQSPGVNLRMLSNLRRGKSNRNMAVLISELRKLKTQLADKPTTSRATTKPKLKPRSETVAPQKELERNQIKEEAVKSYFQKIRYGELPAELKVRFRRLKDLFYDMCDLKFLLNDLPDKAEEEALEIQLKIESLDEQKDTIWKELDHWQTYKTLLPTKTEDDFSKLDAKGLLLKQASLKSSIHKMKKRIEEWETNQKKEEDKLAARKIAQQINRTEKKLHENEINLRKIGELL